MMNRREFISLSALALIAGAFLAACGGSSASTAAPASSEAGGKLSAPTDFAIDLDTGSFSFTKTDPNTGYYFVRVFKLQDGQEAGEYVASSSRINGGETGEATGTLDLSVLTCGDFRAKLMSYAASGSGYENADPVSIDMEYGMGMVLERPEFLTMTSGNQVELVVDWFTLTNYYIYQYMPEMKITFYSDEACTTEVYSETVDLNDLLEGMSLTPPGSGYIWGSTRDATVERYYVGHATVIPAFGEGEVDQEGYDQTYGFVNDIFAFTLEPGTYYVTCQSLSSYSYVSDSQVAPPVQVTVTTDQPSSEYTIAASELWADPIVDTLETLFAKPSYYPDRVDLASAQTTTAQIME